MAAGKRHVRTRYLVSYILALVAAFLSYRTFFAFEARASFGSQIIFLNFAILLLLWFLSFAHTTFIQNNFLMVIVLPLIGLFTTNLLLLFTYPGTSFLGYIGFLLCSSMLVFFSYRARAYEKEL